MATIADSLEAFENSLPEAPQPVGSYVTAVQSGNLVFTSGALPVKDGLVLYQGKVGSITVSLEEGIEAAKLCCINQLSVLKQHLGSLSRIERVIKLTGYVNCVDDFSMQPQVINGASDMLAEVFGEKGRHTRAAVGVNALPLNASVEIDMVVQVSP